MRERTFILSLVLVHFGLQRPFLNLFPLCIGVKGIKEICPVVVSLVRTETSTFPPLFICFVYGEILVKLILLCFPHHIRSFAFYFLALKTLSTPSQSVVMQRAALWLLTLNLNST